MNYCDIEKFICSYIQSSEVAQLLSLTPCDPMVAHQDTLSMGFTRQEYWSVLLFSKPGDLPNSGTKTGTLVSPVLSGKFFTTEQLFRMCYFTKPMKLYIVFNFHDRILCIMVLLISTYVCMQYILLDINQQLSLKL